MQVQIGLRVLKAETVGWLGERLKRGSRSGSGLGRELCEREDWRNATGKLCVAVAAKVGGQVGPVATGTAGSFRATLPDACRARPRHTWPRPVVAALVGHANHYGTHARGPDTRGRVRLSRLDKIRLWRVVSAEDRTLWCPMLDRNHPRMRARAPGCRLTQLLECSRFAILGGFTFVAALMRLGLPDQWLQWVPRGCEAAHRLGREQ